MSHTYQEIFKALFNACQKLDLPIAIWKLPNLEEWQLLIGNDVISIEQTQLETLPPGFIFNKFENKGFKIASFINAKHIFKNTKIHVEQLKADLEGKLYEAFNKELSGTERSGILNKFIEENKSDEVENFKSRVGKAVAEINNGTFQKVILSRKKKLHFQERIDLIDVFEKMSSLYKNAFTSLIFLPDHGIWIGASPETLICIKDSIFRTCSLAGTQQLKEHIRFKDVLWSQKEIEEQAIVTRYIINCFKKIRLREYIEEGPKTVPAGNLLHLRTDLKVDMKEVDFPILGTQMLELLHPTSAVCGMPHEPAFDFIVEQEDFNRELYAGYLGPVNVENSIDIFVNLRCMKIEDKKAILFAGVGITEDSDPQKEWLETEMKFRTLLNVLSS